MLIILLAKSSLLIELAYYLISLFIPLCVSFFFLLPSFFQISSHFPCFVGGAIQVGHVKQYVDERKPQLYIIKVETQEQLLDV